jgi:DNA replication protein DnaC
MSHTGEREPNGHYKRLYPVETLRERTREQKKRVDKAANMITVRTFDDYEALQKQAKKDGTCLAELVRKYITWGLEQDASVET